MAELILKLNKILLFVYYESSSYILCTKSVGFKTVFNDKFILTVENLIAFADL